MNKTQRDLLASCWNKNMKAEYETVRGYAYQFKKYDNMTMRDIDEVVEKLASLYQKGERRK